MILIHGVNHNSQHRGPRHSKANADALEEFVRRICRESKIYVIAEEYSEEACRRDSVEMSLCKSLAAEIGVRHQYCDPTSEERKELGIPSRAEAERKLMSEKGDLFLTSSECMELFKRDAQYFSLREGFWQKQLARFVGRNILFVCGSSHVDSFSALLMERGWETFVK